MSYDGERVSLRLRGDFEAAERVRAQPDIRS